MSLANLVTEIKQVSLRDQVLATIQKLIILGEIQPGGRVIEDQLRKLLGVSRTPVREALILLERDGLVEMQLNKGCFVRTFEPQDIRDIFVFRTALENLGAELVIDKLTEADFDHLEGLIEKQYRCIEAGKTAEGGEYDLEFHTYPIEFSENGPLIGAWKISALNYTILLGYIKKVRTEAAVSRPIHEHRDLMTALRARDLAAVKAIHEEINNWAAEEAVKGLLESRSDSTEE